MVCTGYLWLSTPEMPGVDTLLGKLELAYRQVLEQTGPWVSICNPPFRDDFSLPWIFLLLSMPLGMAKTKLSIVVFELNM